MIENLLLVLQKQIYKHIHSYISPILQIILQRSRSFEEITTLVIPVKSMQTFFGKINITRIHEMLLMQSCSLC